MWSGLLHLQYTYFYLPYSWNHKMEAIDICTDMFITFLATWSPSFVPTFMKSCINNWSLWTHSEAQYNQCTVLPHSVDFDLAHNPNLVQDIFDLPEILPEFSVTVSQTFNADIAFLLKTVTNNINLWRLMPYI